MRAGKSNYTFTVADGFLRIVDLNIGGKTVTNDMENVINEIYQEIGEDVKSYKIIYRDSQKIWDGVIPTWAIKKCVGCDFYHLGETDINLAIEKANQKINEKTSKHSKDQRNPSYRRG